MHTIGSKSKSAPRRSFRACLTLALCLIELSRFAAGADFTSSIHFQRFSRSPRLAHSQAGCAVSGVQVNIVSPFVSPAVISAALNVTPEQVRALIEDGSLLFAWDLSCRTGKRPEIRVLTQCVADYLAHRPAPKSLPTTGQILKTVFPGQSHILAKDLSNAWLVDNDLTLRLLRAGLLRKAPGSKCRSGRGGSPALTFSSVVEFMEERQIL